MRTLAITQNITVDGSIEMLGDWFDPQGQGDTDNSDLREELHRQNGDADGLLVGRRTFQDLRGYWPQQSDDTTGITAYLNQVQKYVVSSTMAQPDWPNSTILTGDVVQKVGALKEEPGQDIVVTGSITLCHADRSRARRPVPTVRLSSRTGPWPAPVPRRIRCQA